MLVAARPARVRWIRTLVGALALLLLAAATRAGGAGPRALEGIGGGGLSLVPTFGGSFDAVLAHEGAPFLLLRASVYDVVFEDGDGYEGSHPIGARLSGVLVEPGSAIPLATLTGELSVDAHGDGQLVAVLHPLAGPDPWKVDIGLLEGTLHGHGTAAAAELQPVRIEARAAFTWSLYERL